MYDGKSDREMAAALLPMLCELENRMVARDHGAQAARVVQLRTYLMCDFGVDKTLSPKDTKTQPLFVGGTGANGAAAAGGPTQ